MYKTNGLINLEWHICISPPPSFLLNKGKDGHVLLEG